MRWVWAAYRRNGLPSLSEIFEKDLQPREFEERFADLLDAGFFCWICEADTDRGRTPVGLVLGRPFVHNTLIMGNMTWFPWSSRRNVLESVVHLVNELRSEVHMLFHVEQHDKRFFNHVAAHGLLRRVGTLYDILDEPIAVYQSRSRTWAR